MYTEEMANSFHAIVAPKHFGVTLVEFDNFISVQVDPNDLIDISQEKAEEIVAYLNKVKSTLESFGVLVNISREAVEDAEYN